MHLTDLGGSRLLLTLASPLGERQEQLLELADGRLQKAADLGRVPGGVTAFANGDLVLNVPAEYVPLLRIEIGAEDGLLFTVSEKASWEAGQKLHPGEDWGDGLLFGIRAVSREEYGDLLLEADPARRPLRRTRYSFTYEGRYFEVDVYPFWDDRALLQVELREKDETVCFPPELTLLEDVTGDESYQSAALAALA